LFELVLKQKYTPTLMDLITEYYNSLKKTFDDIVIHVTDTAIVFPGEPTMKIDASIGRYMRDFIVAISTLVAEVNDNKMIQSETRGLSGTKNEMLRELVSKINSDLTKLVGACNDYIDQLLMTDLAIDTVTQKEINELLREEQLVSNMAVDKVALFKLRKFTKSNAEADYYEYIREQRARLFTDSPQKLFVPLDRFGLIARSAKTLAELFPGAKSYDDLVTLLDPAKYQKNIVIVYRGEPGYIFSSIDPRPDDVTVAISPDFITRMRVVNKTGSIDVPTSMKSIICMPLPGKLTSVYETYDYKTFYFMSTGLDKNLVSYKVALGYYVATVGSAVDQSLVPSISHAGYNKVIDNIFAESYYRYDLTLMASEFKFGQGMSDAIKQRLKDIMLDAADSWESLDIGATIRQATNDVLPKDLTRESSVSSYLGLIRLIDEFTKEYRMATRDVNWDTHKKIAMTDVYNRCVARCDKLGAWSIDFKTPKDLFWK